MSEDDKNAVEPVRLSGLDMRHQPDDLTCGPTCLHAVYKHFGLSDRLEDVIGSVPMLEAGGTLAVTLGSHALRRGIAAEVFTFDLRVCDPTWFAVPGVDLKAKLRERRAAVGPGKLRTAIDAFLEFLALGGVVRMEELTTNLLRTPIKRGLPLLTGLSATWLYREPREDEKGRPDDVAGAPQGHFVVLSGYDPLKREVYVTDPLHPNPLAQEHTYPVLLARVLNAILLGVLTYDANLLVLKPPGLAKRA